MKVEVGLLGVVTTPPAPEMIDHEPVPEEGVLPAKVAVAVQIVWSGPALATVGLLVKVMITLSALWTQGALVIVQRKV